MLFVTRLGRMSLRSESKYEHICFVSVSAAELRPTIKNFDTFSKQSPWCTAPSLACDFPLIGYGVPQSQ